MEVNAGFFAQFVEGGLATFGMYLAAKRKNACWGDDPEIQAMCELYNRPAEIWAYDPQSGSRKLRTFHEAASTGQLEFDNILPYMRLSYYGGGHYDSVMGIDHERNLLTTKPGVQEDIMIQMAQIRILRLEDGGVASSTSTSDMNENERNGQDLGSLTNEQAAFDLAIKKSRMEMEAYGEEDLQTALALSTASKNDNVPDEVFADVEVDSALIASQGQILQDVAEQSEREYLEKALHESLMTETNTSILEDDIIQQVSMASMQEIEKDSKDVNKSDYAFETDLNEDEREMALALEMSQWDVEVVLSDNTNHLTGYEIPDEDEEAQLRATMEESLRSIEPKNSNISNYEYKSLQNYNNDEDEDDDDDDLRKAIEESLRYK